MLLCLTDGFLEGLQKEGKVVPVVQGENTVVNSWVLMGELICISKAGVEAFDGRNIKNSEADSLGLQPFCRFRELASERSV